MRICMCMCICDQNRLSFKQLFWLTLQNRRAQRCYRAQGLAIWLRSSMWQVQFPRGWYDIDQDVQAQISSAYQAGRPTVEFATVKSQRLGLYRRYMIDFGRLQQRNLESGRIRAVRLLQTSQRYEDARGAAQRQRNTLITTKIISLGVCIAMAWARSSEQTRSLAACASNAGQ